MSQDEIKGPRKLAKAIDIKSRQTRKIKEKIATIDQGIRAEHQAECERLNIAMVNQLDLGSVINPVAPADALKRFMKWSIEQMAMISVIRQRQMIVMADMQAEIEELKVAVYGAEELPEPTKLELKKESSDDVQGQNAKA